MKSYLFLIELCIYNKYYNKQTYTDNVLSLLTGVI